MAQLTPYQFNNNHNGQHNNNNKLRYCCDSDKDVLSSNFEKRGWISVDSDEDWNFYW
jgi:hypothetical protein